MTDIINLLPDSVANQIAAGEVVQRPASVVKELLENAIDAQSTEITLHIKEGGTNLIQVTDNGIGMSETDARMCWERHATSKIKKAEDIFSIFSYGFRGEAMASIGAVAQVEMKTMRPQDSIGTFLRIEGSRCLEQKSISCLSGTQTTVRNLFYNVPARRNFLKSISVETKHIFEEFYRVALAKPSLHLKLLNNDKEVYDLEPSNLQERIEEIFRIKSNDKLLSVEEITDIVAISGFIGTPEMAKKTRGEQYIFVNKRFIKNPYFNHAIMGAYEGLIEKSRFPLYVLHFEIEPHKIDVNIHPTKTEVKFEDERFIYTLLQSAIRKAIGQHSLVPDLSLFDKETFHPVRDLMSKGDMTIPETSQFKKIDRPNYNPFDKEVSPRERSNLKNWEKLLGEVPTEKQESRIFSSQQELLPEEIKKENFVPEVLFQLGKTYLVTKKNEQLLIIDQRLAHERVLYERYKKGIDIGGIGTQALLFPRTIELQSSDLQLIYELEDEIKKLGFDFSEFGKNTIILNGIPAGLNKGSELDIFEGLLEQYKYNMKQPGLESRENMLRALALNTAIRRNTSMNGEEMKELIQSLYNCEHPGFSPRGHAISMFITTHQLSKMLN